MVKGFGTLLIGVMFLALFPSASFAQSKGEFRINRGFEAKGDPFYSVDTITIKARKFRSPRPSEETLELLHQQFSEEVCHRSFPLNEQSTDPMSIADLALKVWEIVQENKAVLNVSSMNVKALPNLAKDHWEALTG